MTPLVAIVGETASGKSALGLELAEKFSGEIICADSRTIYLGMDIGTAKPTTAERARVPHHVLDIVNPDEHFNAAQFKEQAQLAIDDITARGKLPIVVGGTGLYVDALLYDYQFREPAEQAERERLNLLSVTELQKEITRRRYTMPENSQNKRHLTRLLEANGQLPTRADLRSNTVVLGTRTSRPELQQRIFDRVRSMLESGLETEVSKLADQYGWTAPGMNGIGYREWQDYFMSTQNIDEVETQIVKDTMKLAKRQRTWFRRNQSVQWLDYRSNTVEIITTFLNK